MKIPDKIMFVKTGWSDLYEGGPILGNHEHLKSNANIGHELYNFKETKYGYYYAYIPPVAGSCPQISDNDAENWLVVFLARINGNGKLCVVGYYENATIYNTLKMRPEYDYELFDTDNEGNPFCYCIKTKKAVRLPSQSRKEWAIRSDLCNHIKSTPVVYIKGPKAKDEPWRKEFSKIAENLLNNDKITTVPQFPNINAETRSLVEKKAVDVVWKYYEKKNYKVIDRQKDNCGYDLLVANNKEELHIEVKGTAMNRLHLYLSLNEFNYMMASSKWRLAIVKDALNDKAKPQIFDKKEFEENFNIQPIEWVAEEK